MWLARRRDLHGMASAVELAEDSSVARVLGAVA